MTSLRQIFLACPAAAYVVRMTPGLQSMVAVTYVRDIDASRAFYALLGFQVERSGQAPDSAWTALGHNGHSVLLASTSPPLGVPRLPLLFYFFLDDLDGAVAGIRAAGVPADHLGYPPHARGGEVKVVDPDGNTVLLGQAERSASQAPAGDEQDSPHFSLLKEAAGAVRASGGAMPGCQVRSFQGTTCQNDADVKLADSAGDTVWACLEHADEILVTVPAAFIASQGEGIAGFLSRRG
jgi:catechol 2,3-dioxygenase-like lactoylglutathione lyase family enzyme